jgi:hypothetical protein
VPRLAGPSSSHPPSGGSDAWVETQKDGERTHICIARRLRPKMPLVLCLHSWRLVFSTQNTVYDAKWVWVARASVQPNPVKQLLSIRLIYSRSLPHPSLAVPPQSPAAGAPHRAAPSSPLAPSSRLHLLQLPAPLFSGHVLVRRWISEAGAEKVPVVRCRAAATGSEFRRGRGPEVNLSIDSLLNW